MINARNTETVGIKKTREKWGRGKSGTKRETT